MLTIRTQPRKNTKSENARMRKEGFIPSVYYGPKTESVAVAVPQGEFKHVWQEAGESTIIELETPNGKMNALIYGTQVDPVTGQPIHIDFYIIEEGKKIHVTVPLEFEGTAPAVKEKGGILVKVFHDLEIEALPQNLPHDIKVDISGLTDFDSQILVQDIALPEGVTALANPDDVVASVSEAKEEEEAPAEAVDMDAIEVEQKGKKEEEEEATGE